MYSEKLDLRELEIGQLKPTVLPTGIFALDRNLGGGLPAGSLTYISADPISMSEIFVHQFTQARKTYYFTTNRKANHIQRDILSRGFDISDIEFVDIYSEYYYTPYGDLKVNAENEHIDSKIVEFTEYSLNNIVSESMDEEINIIIDDFSFFLNLNITRGLLKSFLNILYEASKNVQGIVYLYALKDTHPDNLENGILNTVDVIVDVMIERGADKVTSKICIPKIRGKNPLNEMIKFKFAEGIQIDTSKDIA